MGSLDDLECKDTQELAPGELAMLRKAQEFFQTCDAGGKGFIARSDMQVRGPSWACPPGMPNGLPVSG